MSSSYLSSAPHRNTQITVRIFSISLLSFAFKLFYLVHPLYASNFHSFKLLQIFAFILD